MLTSQNLNVVHRWKYATDRVGELQVGDPGKRARTSLAAEITVVPDSESDTELPVDSEMEPESETATPQGSFQKNVSIQLSGGDKVCSKGVEQFGTKTTTYL